MYIYVYICIYIYYLSTYWIAIEHLSHPFVDCKLVFLPSTKWALHKIVGYPKTIGFPIWKNTRIPVLGSFWVPVFARLVLSPQKIPNIKKKHEKLLRRLAIFRHPSSDDPKLVLQGISTFRHPTFENPRFFEQPLSVCYSPKFQGVDEGLNRKIHYQRWIFQKATFDTRG